MAKPLETPPSFIVLIPAAGKGARMGGAVPKQYQKIYGKSVLRHTVERFHDMPECTRICVIINPDDADLCHDAVQGLEKIEITHGGEERNSTIFNALHSILNVKNEDIILIHDAARPCVHPVDIRKLLEELQTHRAATLAAPISATLRKGDSADIAQDVVPRDGLWNIQTPQGFRYGDLLKAHEQADAEHTHTDDSQLVSALGITVKLVQGSQENIKITVPQDLDMAEKVLSSSMEIRSGQGFDVHAFDMDKPGPVRLCGIDIEHDYALKGHSDADVGLHTLTDAIYGALAAGDIGIHFPPSDNTFKDMDSTVFLEHAAQMLRNKGGALINADVTLICERPKIGPHALAMRARIAEICGVPISRINVKATTTEKLGFTGRGEGIAAQAIVNIKLPEGTLDE